jgi:hypothetical protein
MTGRRMLPKPTFSPTLSLFEPRPFNMSSTETLLRRDPPSD